MEVESEGNEDEMADRDETLREIRRRTIFSIAEWLQADGQQAFENDHTELVGDVASEIAAALGLSEKDAIVEAWELMPYREGYELYNSWHGTAIKYLEG